MIKKHKERRERSRFLAMTTIRSLAALFLLMDMWLIIVVWYHMHLDYRTFATLLLVFGEWFCVRNLKRLVKNQLQE